VTHAANMHLIPATHGVAHALSQVRKGHVVSLRGQLVDVLRVREGLHVRSSLTREDTGAGACELIWVDDLQLQR